MGDERTATFKQKTVLQLISQFFQDGKTKMNNEALLLVTEVLTIFVAEAATRAVDQTKKEGLDEVTIDQFEKILPQLLLDM
ncbi:hypothetical protein ScPMuIL_005103 [Solemya velum]